MVNEYVLLLGGQAVENKFNWSVILSFWIVCIQSPKFNRVSLNETPEFPFRGLNIQVNFNLRDSEKETK